VELSAPLKDGIDRELARAFASTSLSSALRAVKRGKTANRPAIEALSETKEPKEDGCSENGGTITGRVDVLPPPWRARGTTREAYHGVIALSSINHVTYAALRYSARVIVSFGPLREPPRGSSSRLSRPRNARPLFPPIFAPRRDREGGGGRAVQEFREIDRAIDS